MKKIVLGSVIAALAGGAYWYSSNGTLTNETLTNSSTSSSILSNIPADTLVFSGQLVPFPIKDYLSLVPQFNEQLDVDDIHELLGLDEESLGENLSEEDAVLAFAAFIFQTYYNGLAEPEVMLKKFGLGEKVSSVVYSLGMIPVVRTEIENIDALWALLDDAEEFSHYTHEARQVEGIEYRYYALPSLPKDIWGENAGVVIAHQDGMLTTTLVTDIEPDALSYALNLKKVPATLTDANILPNLIQKYGFLKDSISYINNVELMKGATSENSNMFGKQLRRLNVSENSGLADFLSDVSAPACASEFNAIAEDWPKLVLGFKQMDITKDHAKFAYSTILETKNQTVLSAMKMITGHIPAPLYQIDNSLFSLGLGINTEQVADSIDLLLNGLKSTNYQCDALNTFKIEFSDGMNDLDLNSLKMFSSMMAGLKGASISLADMKIDNTQSPSIDALLTISADKPEQLFNTINQLSNLLPGATLTKDSEPLDLSVISDSFIDTNLGAWLAIKGNNLVVYTGEKSLTIADKLKDDKLQNNGLFNFVADYHKLNKIAQMLPEAELARVLNLNMKLQMNTTVNEHGLIIDVNADITPIFQQK